jgi:hypothetical protein
MKSLFPTIQAGRGDDRRRLAYAAAVAFVALANVVAPITAEAQRRAGIGFGASLGANVPSGDYDKSAKPGAVANAFLELRTGTPLALRANLLWSRSDIDNPLIRSSNGTPLPPVSAGSVSGDVNMIGASLDGVWSLGSGFVEPYLVGGIGVYRRRVSQDISGTIDEFKSLRHSDTDVGYNGGLGLALNILSASIFAEARYFAVRTSPERTNFIPVTLGIRF